jgi:hypothetical protein
VQTVADPRDRTVQLTLKHYSFRNRTWRVKGLYLPRVLQAEWQNSCGRAPPKIYLIAGGFHLVTAPDDTIAKTVAALKDTFKVENVAPGHCTGEPTFAALKQAFRTRYIYAGVGTSLPLGQSTGPGERRGDGPVLEDDDLTTYRKLARREDPFGVRSRSLR